MPSYNTEDPLAGKQGYPTDESKRPAPPSHSYETIPPVVPAPDPDGRDAPPKQPPHSAGC